MTHSSAHCRLRLHFPRLDHQAGQDAGNGAGDVDQGVALAFSLSPNRKELQKMYEKINNE